MNLHRRYRLKPDPIGEPRNSLAVYLLALCCVSGLVTLLGTPASNAVAEALGPIIVRAWGAALFLGCGATLVGMFWQGNPRDGLTFKRLGMYAVVVAAAIYSCAAVWVAHWGGVFIALVVGGLGVAAWLQYRKIRRRIAKIERFSP